MRHLLFALALGLSSCIQPVMDHAIVEFEFPDKSIEKIHVGMNNYVLLFHDDRQFILRAKTIHDNSIDLEVVACTTLLDSAKQEFSILKMDGQLRHFVFGKQDELIGEKSGIMVRIAGVEALNKEVERCHGNDACCYASCSLVMCCTGGPGSCHDATCDCSPTVDCGLMQQRPDIFNYAKLFSREKLKVNVPFENKVNGI